MLTSLRAVFFCASLAIFSMAAHAKDAPAPQTMSAEDFLATLNFQKGRIALPGGVATLDLPDAFRYLSPDDAKRVLEDAWGNPPGDKPLGMIVPADVSPLSQAGWGVIVTYEQDGHVKDGDADSIKYDDLLKDMKEAVHDHNAQRKEQGYEAMELVGWAETPTYDKGAHKLYWAKELEIGGHNSHTLNYSVRVLGREGVLVLNAVAGMNQIAGIKAEMPGVVKAAEFTPGHRYADFNDKTDKVAEYGIAALVAGGLAAKLGLFGKLFALLLAFKKIILVALFAGGSFILKLFGRGKKEAAPVYPSAPMSEPEQSAKVSLDKVNLDK